MVHAQTDVSATAFAASCTVQVPDGGAAAIAASLSASALCRAAAEVAEASLTRGLDPRDDDTLLRALASIGADALHVAAPDGTPIGEWVTRLAAGPAAARTSRPPEPWWQEAALLRSPRMAVRELDEGGRRRPRTSVAVLTGTSVVVLDLAPERALPITATGVGAAALDAFASAVVAAVCAGRLRDDLSAARTVDPLTGCLTLPAFERVLDAHLDRLADGAPGGLALLCVDVTDLRSVNDERGRRAGDAVLRSLGQRCCDLARPTDAAARIGEDTFVLLAPVASLDDASGMVGALEAVASAPVLVRGPSIPIEVAVAGVFVPGPGHDGDGVLRSLEHVLSQVRRGRMGGRAALEVL